MEGKLTLARIRESVNERLSKHPDSKQASNDTVTMAWLLMAVDVRDKEIERLSAFGADEGRINFLELENFKARYTGRCVFRVSPNGRGFRIHETESKHASDTVREAIDKAMKVE